jgi:hypothetical protein
MINSNTRSSGEKINRTSDEEMERKHKTVTDLRTKKKKKKKKKK